MIHINIQWFESNLSIVWFDSHQHTMIWIKTLEVWFDLYQTIFVKYICVLEVAGFWIDLIQISLKILKGPFFHRSNMGHLVSKSSKIPKKHLLSITRNNFTHDRVDTTQLLCEVVSKKPKVFESPKSLRSNSFYLEKNLFVHFIEISRMSGV